MVSPQSLMHTVELPGGEIRNTPLHVVSVAVWPNGVEHQAPVQCLTEWLLNSSSETKTNRSRKLVRLIIKVVGDSMGDPCR